MKLNVTERIVLLQILPKEESFLTFKILMDLKASLAFTEKEIKEWGIKEDNGRMMWKKSEDKDWLSEKRLQRSFRGH